MFIFDSVLMNMMYVYAMHIPFLNFSVSALTVFYLGPVQECIAGKKCHFDELVLMTVIHLHNSAVFLPCAHHAQTTGHMRPLIIFCVAFDGFPVHLIVVCYFLCILVLHHMKYSHFIWDSIIDTVRCPAAYGTIIIHKLCDSSCFF